MTLAETHWQGKQVDRFFVVLQELNMLRCKGVGMYWSWDVYELEGIGVGIYRVEEGRTRPYIPSPSDFT